MPHLSYEQRYTIEVLLKTNKSKVEIASTLEVDKSVIYKEINGSPVFSKLNSPSCNFSWFKE